MSSLTEFGRQWFEDIIETTTEWFQDGLVEGYHDITETVFGTLYQKQPETSSLELHQMIRGLTFTIHLSLARLCYFRCFFW